MNQKVGRNDPCPCGSGKKFKKCCEHRLGSKKKFQASVISSGMSRGQDLQGKAMKISTDVFNRPPDPSPKKDLSDVKKGKPQHPPEADKPM